MDSLMLRRRAINLNLDAYITFADATVQQMCADAWGDGTGLTRRQAMFVTNAQFGAVFNGTETGITSFNELRFFAGLTQVPSNAFKNCVDLTSVMIPSSVTDIRDNAFNGCSALESINLVNVTSIRYNAFNGCSSLSVELELPNLTSLPYDSFRGSGITKVRSLGTIASMGSYGNFRNCSSLTDVVLPSSLTSMGRQHFWDCTNLETVKILATTPPSVAGANFYNCGDAKIYIPYSEDHSILAAYQDTWGQNAGALDNDVPRLAELDENGNIPE